MYSSHVYSSLQCILYRVELSGSGICQYHT